MVSFRKWMEQYKEECSPIGDLARNIAADETFPKSSNVDVIFGYMEKHDARLEYYRVFYRVWGMYERECAREKLLRYNYAELANAIILQAARDYRDALEALAKNPESMSAKRYKSDCERFFLGEWFSELTEIDGKQLMHKLQREAGQS